MIKQKSIVDAVTVSGIGVHCGEHVTLRIRPAPANSGIRFVRVDLPGRPEILACPEAVHSTAQATVLGGEGFTIATTEHCLAAFAGFEIDNAVVEVDGAELPIGDGSAQTYMDALEQAGSEEQNAAREYIVITERVVFGDDETFAAIEPYQGLRISCSIAFSHRRIGDQSLVLDLNPQSFKREIGPACSSAQTYLDALEQAGSEEQNAAREYIVITERVVFGDDETFAAIEPYQGLRISCSIAFSHRRIGDQSLVLDVNPQSFKREIGPARTFGFLKDRERAKAMGLGLGASLENTVVLDDAGVLNAGGLRFPDEFVRHKMLDALGDLAVLGRPVRGHLEARCSGHEVMQGLVKIIAANESCYRREEL